MDIFHRKFLFFRINSNLSIVLHTLSFYLIFYIKVSFRRFYMFNRNCHYLTAIPVSIIISFLFTLLFYIGIITNTLSIFIFALIISLLSMFLIGLFGISDNGLTRERLCKNCILLIISIIGNALFNLLALAIPLVARRNALYYHLFVSYFLFCI